MSKYRVCAVKGCRRKAIDDCVPSPKEYVEGKSITFLGWTLLLYKEQITYLSDICIDCLRDNQQEVDKRIFDEGYNKGYEDVPLNW